MSRIIIPSAPRQETWVRWLAGSTIAFHATGLALAASGMRPGTPAAPLDSRMAYLAGSPPLWTIGWLVWMGCAVTFGLFVLRLKPSRLVILLTTTAVAVDLACDYANIIVIPRLAGSGSVEAFSRIEELARAGGIFVANGLYSVSVALLSLPRKRRVRRLGLLVLCFGVGMILADLAAVQPLFEAMTGLTMVCFMLWAYFISRPG